MALNDKNILITPNIGASEDPKIVFSGANSSVSAQNITLKAYPTNNGTLSFEGSAGQLFSITNTLSGTIYSVNDVSGIPSIEVLDTGLVKLAQYSGNVLVGTGTDNADAKFQVTGGGFFTGSIGNSKVNKGVYLGLSSGNDPMIQLQGNGAGNPHIDFDNGTGDYDMRIILEGDDILTVSGGYLNVQGSTRSPIFYDSDNTGYYVDPASTSSINYLTTAGHIDVNGIYLRAQQFILNTAGTGWNTVVDRNGGDAWIVYGGGSVRAPIFYDSNNTGYYWDGASTSKWNESNQDGWHTFNNYGLGITGTYAAERLQTVFAMGSSYRMAADGLSTANMYGVAWSHPNAGSLGGANNLNDHGLLIINNGTFRAAISSRAVFSADVRGTLFYDYNNTGYYADPASTSNVNALTVNGASYHYGGVSTTGIYGVGVKNGNNWAGMVIASDAYKSCGIHYGGGYQELRFGRYGNAFGAFEANPFVFDMANGIAYATASYRAAAFYDSDNTGYYTDPASTSNLNGLTVAATISGSVSGSAASITGTATSAINSSALGSGTASSSTYLRGDRTWASLVSGATISDTAPSASQGSLWWDSTSGRLFIYYTDANTSQWVDASPGVGPQGPQGATGATGPTGPTGPTGATGGITGGTLTGVLTGATVSLAMVVSNTTNNGGIVHRATGTGDSNLAGETFWNDSYAIKLGIRADGYFGLGGWSRAAWSWYSDPNGNMVAAGNVTAYSDPRLKENFQQIQNPMAILNNLTGGTFNWKHGYQHIKNKAGKRDYGVLADQVEAVMPEIVTESITLDDQSFKTVAYEKIIPVLIEAIKTQQKQIDGLEAIVEALRND